MSNPRKRPAPSATPMAPMPPPQQPFSAPQPDGLYTWNGGIEDNGFVAAGQANSFTMMSPPGQYGQPVQPAPPASTALARRQNNRAMVHPGGFRPQFPGADTWHGLPEDVQAFPSQPTPVGLDETDSIERLEERAVRAKREAQAKRKQIPPFVQKLSSFLDEDRNTDLIRWSEKGDSFIVLDEDEFAKSLIPELFKHNNYASFVRQLNMYGFHKRVGLSDNSMKASERKNKSPSEYHNPYFRRGHPNLLWLINKPKSTSNKKKQSGKKDEVDADSDEENAVEEVFAPPVAAAPIGRTAANAGDLGPLQKKDLVQVKTQLERLQQQQATISNVLGKLRADHANLYKQALMFQTMHERHENSINAILNFLANVFRKSLEEQGGAHTIQDLLSSILPNAQAHGQPQMPQGNIIDLDDYVNRPAQSTPAISTPKRPQRLLPPIPHQPVGKANTLSPSETPSPAPLAAGYQGPQMGSVTEVFDASPSDAASPNFIKDELRTNPQEGMLKIIHDTNAVNASGIDLPNIAAQSSIRMDDDQRTKMLSMMAGQSTAPPPTNGRSMPTPGPSASIPSTPDISMSTSAGLSLSPVLGSIHPPPLRDFQATQSELEALQQLQSNQANQISQLSGLLGPLSPSGRIPGLETDPNPNNGYFGNVDYDEFLNANAFDPNSNFDSSFGGMGVAGNANGDDFNFSLDGSSGVMGGVDDMSGYVPVSSAAAAQGAVAGFDMGSVGGALFETASASTPSEAGTEEIPRNDLEMPERDPKRRRKG